MLLTLTQRRYSMLVMSTAMTWETASTSLRDTLSLGEAVGQKLKGGEVIELIGDLGAGKTAFVRGLAKGMGLPDEVASPSFVIRREYCSESAQSTRTDGREEVLSSGVERTDVRKTSNGKTDKANVGRANGVAASGGEQVSSSSRLCLHHYDFYRLETPGVAAEELKESLADDKSATIMEWADTVADVLPPDRLKVTIKTTGPDSRRFAFWAGPGHARLLRGHK